MSHTPLGEVCLTLGLMRTEDVDLILTRLREGARARFGELAIELGLLDDEGLARALAHQFRLNMVPPERLARLSVAPEVLDLLPRGLVRERLLLPTFLDEEKRVLSLLTSDPTDIPSLRAAQTAARAARLRLFVAPRGAMRILVDRLLPEDDAEERTQDRAPPEVPRETAAAGLTVVFEPDPERAAALRRLEAAEGGTTEIVGDPEQVSAFIEANQADRVFFRRAVLSEVEPYLPSWHRLRPLLQICALDGFGPGHRIGIPYDRTRDFFFGLLGHLVLDADGASGTGRRTAELARAMAEGAGLPTEQRDTVAIASMFTALGDGADRPGEQDEAAGIRWAADLLRAWDPPYDVQSLFDALLTRVRGEAGPGGHLGAEMLYTARAAVRASLGPGDDPIATLGGDAARHDATALQALAGVLRRWGLRDQLRAAENEAGAVVVVASDASPGAAATRAGLSAEGYTVATADGAPEALRLAHSLRAGALVADGADDLEAALRADGSIPVVRMEASPTTGEASALPALLGALRKVLRRRPEAPPAVTGRLSDLPLVDILQTLLHGGRTARIVVVGTADLGAVQVRDGHLVAATHGTRIGEAALQTLVSGREGRFEVRFEDGGVTNLAGTSEFLLLDALRKRDEQRA
ncbi:MAG: DUF4388 domain-containing protein [Pseudomonadota bacterium]|nr:DUF4388 domain-containing protein [Pseudomonadota bacterium]